jgi:stage II sporulation SpoD-like protein
MQSPPFRGAPSFIRRACALAALAAVVAAAPAWAAKTRPPAPAPRGWVVDRARFEPLDPATTLVADGAGEYRGALEVRPASGGLATVNEVGLDDYLRGLSEVPPTWPAEAMRAQAVAARSYALHEVRSTVATPFRAAGAQICATDACQVYTGIARERQDGAPAWNAAVAATSGQVVLYKGAPINAKYSASNGGRSSAGGEPYLRSVSDPDDAASPYHHWHYTLPLGTFAPVLGVTAPATLVGLARNGDNVAYRVQTPAPAGLPGQPPPPLPPPATQTIGVGDFMAKVNASVPNPPGLPLPLPSGRFSLGTEGEQAVVDGGGWGHGVGLNQWGAFAKAKRGMKASDILAAYYGGLRPTALPPDQLPPTVRVAVALGEGQATVSAGGRFRVLDGAGHPLAALALGRWQVVAAGNGRVRVVPPQGYDQPLAITPVAVDPAAPAAGAPATLRFRVSTPAVVRMTVEAPGASPVTVEPGVIDAGEAVQALPPAARGGDYRVLIQADAGPGRTAALPFIFAVAGPARALLPPPSLLAAPGAAHPWDRPVAAWREFPSRAPLLLAAVLVLANAVGLVGALARRGTRRLRLH